MRRDFHILSLGAGVQSTALALMFEEGLIKPQLDAAIFADTQDEPAAVYRHLEWLQKRITRFPLYVRSKGRLSDDLRRGVNSTGGRFASIPAYTKGDGDERKGRVPRQCSREYKIEVIERAIRTELLGLQPGKHVPADVRVVQYIGISLDEAGRAMRVLLNNVPSRHMREAQRMDYARLLRFFDSRRWQWRFPLIDSFMTRPQCRAFLQSRVPHPEKRQRAPQWSAGQT